MLPQKVCPPNLWPRNTGTDRMNNNKHQRAYDNGHKHPNLLKNPYITPRKKTSSARGATIAPTIKKRKSSLRSDGKSACINARGSAPVTNNATKTRSVPPPRTADHINPVFKNQNSIFLFSYRQVSIIVSFHIQIIMTFQFSLQRF